MDDADYTPSPEEQVILDWMSSFPFHGRDLSLFNDPWAGRFGSGEVDYAQATKHGIASGWHHEPLNCSYCTKPIEPRTSAVGYAGSPLHPACRDLTKAEREELERPAREEAERIKAENARIAAERGHASYIRIEPDPNAEF